jgi:hypothetical protein
MHRPILQQGAALLLFFTFSVCFARSQSSSIFDQIYRGDQQVPGVVIMANWDSLEHRTQQQTPGFILFQNAEGETEKWPVRLEKRGAYRQLRCEIPPLKLDFGKGKLRRKGLSTHDDIKLVRYCIYGEKGKEYLLREYLAYQLLQTLTDCAFRVQLVAVTYRHQETGAEEQQLGIFIEDTDQLAERLELVQPSKGRMGFKQEELDPDCAMRTSLFEYMIGNADWALFLGKNVKLLKDTSANRFHCVPYDFDFSGLVNAEAYAKPTHGQKKMTDRVYRGVPASRKQLAPIVQEFLDNRRQMEATVQSCLLLSDSSKVEVIEYLDGFFEEVDTRAFYKMVEQADPIENKF